MRKFSVLVVALLLALAAFSVSAQDMGTIVEIAAGNEDFSTLVAAVQAAGLVEALNGEGPFTVFAPTNEAFAALLEDLEISAEDLLADVETLTAVLTYHVVAGKVMSSDLLAATSATTLQGEDIAIGLSVNGIANVIAPDIEASNGVIHVIDAVLLPPAEEMDEPMMEATEETAMEEPGTIVEIAVGNEDFSTLVAAVQAAGLVDALNAEGPFTVFAPTNAAFLEALEALGIDAADLLGNTELLTSILTYHVVSGAVLSSDLLLAPGATTLQGSDLTFGLSLNNGEAIVIAPDIEASNGVIHVIDGVILPPSVAEALMSE